MAVVLGCILFLCLLLVAALRDAAGRAPHGRPRAEGGARSARGAGPPPATGAFDVRIVVADRAGGVQRDAELLAERFAAAGARPTIVRHAAQARPPWRPVFVQVLVEHVQTPDFRQLYPAAWHFLLVNPEFVYDWDLAALRRGEARALCKTRSGLDAVRLMGIEGELFAFGGRPDPPAEPGPAPAPDSPAPDLVLHLAGPSPLKGTLELLKAWVALGEQRGTARLFVACREPANAAALEYWATLGPAPARFEVPGGGGLALETETAAGVYLCRRELPESTAAALRQAAAIHACPSAAEGWGHILDRARWCGAVVVTLDAPPMNELLDGESAVLAPAVDGGPARALLPPAWQRFYPADTAGPRAVRPAPGALSAALARALQMGAPGRRRLGAAARARAEADAAAFTAAAARLWAAPFGPSALGAPDAYAAYAVGEPGPGARASYDEDFRFEVDRRDLHIQAALRQGFPYGKLVTLALEAFARAGDVACDIGANIGTVAVPLSRAAGRTVQVLAFEPQPAHYELLCRNIAANGAAGVVAFRAAVAHAAGEARLSRSTLEPAGPGGPLIEKSRDAAGPLNLGAVQLGEGGEPVRLLRLDDLALPRLDLLKVDAEGAEPLVFHGAQASIRRSKPVIVFEANRAGLPAEMRRALAPPEEAAAFDVLRLCHGLGYRRLVELGVQDYLLVPPGRREHGRRFRTRRVAQLVGLPAERTRGFTLEKLERQEWGRADQK
jgi:FkbM family methyltransferase